MKERTVSVRPGLGPSVTAVVVAIAAYAALPPWRYSWWPFTAITVAALLALLVRVRRHSLATWITSHVRLRRARHYGTPVAAAVDIRHGNDVYGVRTEGNEAVAVIRVDGHAYEPTFLRGGATVAHTVNVLPLHVWCSSSISLAAFARLRYRLRRIPGAPRIRLPAALQHIALGARRGRTTGDLLDSSAQHPRIAVRLGVSALDRVRRGGRRRSGDQGSAARRRTRGAPDRRRTGHRARQTRARAGGATAAARGPRP